jgi:hypothetical protein
MIEQELQNKINEINDIMEKWKQDPPLQDHQHSGFDASKVRWKDIDGEKIAVGFTSRARAYMSGNQTIGDSAWTKVKLDTESYDGDSEFNTGTYRFTATTTGYYQVNATLKWESPAATVQYAIAIYKDNAVYSQNNAVSVNTAVFSQSISDVVYLAAGSYVELFAIQTTGGNDVIEGGALNKTFMSVHRLS